MGTAAIKDTSNMEKVSTAILALPPTNYISNLNLFTYSNRRILRLKCSGEDESGLNGVVCDLGNG